MIENACALAANAKVHLMRHDPTLPGVPEVFAQKQIVAQIMVHLEAEGKLGWFVLLRAMLTWVVQSN